MGIKAAIACLLLLAVAAAPGGALVPAASAGKVGAALSTGAWVEDAVVGVLQAAEAAPLMKMLAVAASGVVGSDEVVHRRVLQAQGGGYINPALVANQQRCIGGCSQPGQPYTGRGNQCIYQNQSC